MIYRLVRFRSDIQDDAKESPDGKILEPPGRIHAELLRKKLGHLFENLNEPWDEEGYAWEFMGRFSGTTVSLLTSTYEEGQIQTLVSAVSIFPWLFRRQKTESVDCVAQAVAKTLEEDGRMRDIRVLTEADERKELQAFQRTSQKDRG